MMTPKDQRSLDRVAADDARWFRKNKGRSFRTRFSDPAEIKELQSMQMMEPVPHGLRCVTVVKQITRGVRARAFLLVKPGHDPEQQNEESAAVAFNQVAKVGLITKAAAKALH